LDHTAFGVEEVASEERGGSIDYGKSASSDNSSGSPSERAHLPLSWKIDEQFSDICVDNPIDLLGDDDSSAPEAEVDDRGLRAESAALATGLLIIQRP
jgi:hypothetical protein